MILYVAPIHHGEVTAPLLDGNPSGKHLRDKDIPRLHEVLQQFPQQYHGELV